MVDKKLAEMILKALDEYKLQLFDNKRISPTKFDAMQTAIYGCKCIVKDSFGIPRSQEIGLSK